MGKKQKSSFLVQGTILIAAQMLCRIIGLLYRRPLFSVIGEQGMGYYGFAYTIYSMVLLIASFSIPLAVSKAIASRLAMKQYRNAQRVFHGALIYAVIVGGAGFIFTYVGAPLLVPNEGSVFALRTMSPTIFFSGILGVLRGYFQGHNTMVPTSVSQIIEQILNAVVSVVMAYVLVAPYVGHATKAAAFKLAEHGAAGSAIGTGAGVLVGLLFCFIIYLSYRPKVKIQMKHDKTKKTESYKRIVKILIFTITPVIFSTFIYNCSASIDSTLFGHLLTNKGLPETTVSAFYGLFSSQYNVLINVPIAIASSLSNAIVPDIAGSYAVNDQEAIKSNIDTAVRFILLIAIPCAVGIAVLAKPVIGLLFGPKYAVEGLSPRMLQVGAVSIVFYCLSTMTNGILQGLGKMRVPVKHSAISVAANVAVLVILIQTTNSNVYAIVLATVAFSVVMSILNARALTKFTGYRQDLKKSVLKPVFSAGIMGAVIFIISWAFEQFISGASIGYAACLAVAVPVGMIIYFVFVIKLKTFSEEELKQMPKGHAILRLAKKLKLL